jgi:hypothetical protein
MYSTEHCQKVNAFIEFDRFNVKKAASGTYEIELSDARKAEGSFRVVRRPQKEPFLCE